ncbi:MAG TPA: hypothetical protein VFA07_04675 [Chthonomonadaceae bacterium]|nr:hypothetical protein [Chthonomonadaceae bacterium]
MIPIAKFPWPSKNNPDEQCEVYIDKDIVRIDAVGPGLDGGRYKVAKFRLNELPDIIAALQKAQKTLTSKQGNTRSK